ncbi:hypothetical protein [Paracoccus alkanivorans]|uniref:DUF2497 domain-containing protein n=1 Tax=Paracoccus alkanivorans TaxID=2116655 RepID=A0A3M0M3D5_9RHOB|nr:hypothetical protein [Paracoccus alkanivorans]RMC31991.1 hypothetical protein C9E81_19140 [Paracoccus alkanivorans]
MRSAKQQKLAAFRRKIVGDTSVTAMERFDGSPNAHADENDPSAGSAWLGANTQDQGVLPGDAALPIESSDPYYGHVTGIAAMTEGAPDSSENIEEIVSSQIDESENAHPPVAGVENDATDTEKEDQMQTAKQLTPLSDSGIAEKVDLRDEAPAKPESAQDKVQALTSGGLGSLFGPIIEDDVKGVRSQIREMIQGELQGELGQRFSRNLRIVIRREIAAAVDDQFDRV